LRRVEQPWDGARPLDHKMPPASGVISRSDQ